MLLFAVGIWVLIEAWRRFSAPPEIRSGLMLAVAIVGLVANAVSARLHLHARTITSGMNVVSAHVVINEGADPTQILDRLGACLSGDFDIEHSTFQLEPFDRRRIEDASHR